MKTIIKYQCEICGSCYSKEADAIACELQSRPIRYPQGLITAGDEGDFYDHRLAFAVASCDTCRHSLDVSMWACRDRVTGDSLGDETCGGGSFIPDEFKVEWLSRPPVKRLIAWLEVAGIVPSVWMHGKAIAVKDIKVLT